MVKHHRFFYSIKAMKQNKDHIFHTDDVPKKKMGPMQLITKGTIALTVTERTKIGTDKLCQKNLVVTIPMAK